MANTISRRFTNICVFCESSSSKNREFEEAADQLGRVLLLLLSAYLCFSQPLDLLQPCYAEPHLVEIHIGNGSNNYRGGNGNRGKGNKGGGRYPCKSNQRIHCQLCAKPGHGALQCYRHFDQQF
ncbi:hypothetical protein ACOSQ2_004996 [Xanthoceras sorbifolium]